MRSVNGDVLEREFLLKHYYSVAEKVIEEGAGNAPMYYVTAMERYFMRCSDRSAAQGFTRYYSISGLEVIDPGRWARNARRDMNKTFTTIPTNDIMMDAAFNIVCPPLMKSISDSGLF
jgi:hypothetical protein